MHQKKSEIQIGKESSGISSDFNPSPPLQIQIPQPPSPPTKLNHDTTTNKLISNSTPHKRTMNQHQHHHHHHHHLSHSPTLSSLRAYNHAHTHTHNHPFASISTSTSTRPSQFFITSSARVLRHIRKLRIHLRILLLLSFPSFYFFISNPTRSFLLEFLSALAFSLVLLLFLNLALPRFPSLRLLLSKPFPKGKGFPLLNLNLRLCGKKGGELGGPVLWWIGDGKGRVARKESWPVSGYGVQQYSNRDVYEGEFHKGKCSGSGVYYYNMSGKYEGDWVDEKYDGFGVETWARGSRYRGQYRQGLRHGFGIYRFYTGDVYAGEWGNGQSHGCGVHTCEDSSRYIGEFKWGVKHGLGHYHFRNGDTFAGEYFGDKMHGFGVYCFGNGHRYEGAWHEGRRQGLGIYTFRNGETQSGHWQNGVLDVPSTQNTHPGSPIAVNHSKVLNAVQEARRAAEKAYEVVRVDDRVNKAVAGANKAANAARVAAVKAVQKRMHHDDDNLPISIV